MNNNLAGNKTKRHGSLTKEEISVLFSNIEEKPSQEEKNLSDYFNEIVKLDALTIQKAIQKAVGQVLAQALKSVDAKVQNKIFRNMTKRASTILKEDMEYMGPIRLKDVEEAQRKFLSIIYHLVNTGEITVPEDFIFSDNLDQAFISLGNNNNTFKDIKEFAVYLSERHQGEELYGCFSKNITMCRFSETRNNENILADIEQTNREQKMGNFIIPNTNIKLINFSICPKCAYIFSFKELIDYYANPKPDNTFRNRAEQYREDTRVLCHECETYFLPALVITDGTPKNEVQFLCRVQTTHAIEVFYRNMGKNVLSAKKENILEREEAKGETARAILNDVSLKEMSPKPTLISNLLQYTPANLALNLIDGSNFQKGDVLFGAWQ